MTVLYTAFGIYTKSDVNGTPGRGWLIQRIGDGGWRGTASVLNGGELKAGMITKAIVYLPRFCGFVSEGYAGRSALGTAIAPHGIVVELGEVAVTLGQFRDAQRTPFNPHGFE